MKRDEECNSNNTYVIVNHGNMTMNDGVHVEDLIQDQVLWKMDIRMDPLKRNRYI